MYRPLGLQKTLCKGLSMRRRVIRAGHYAAAFEVWKNVPTLLCRDECARWLGGARKAIDLRYLAIELVALIASWSIEAAYFEMSKKCCSFNRLRLNAPRRCCGCE